MSLFLFVFTFGAIWLKMLPKVRNSEKIYKWGMAKYTGGVYRKEVQPSVHIALGILTRNLYPHG